MSKEIENKNKNFKILLVDDSEVILRYVANLLEDQGWEVSTATALPNVLFSFAQKPRPNVLITDYILSSNLTGLQLIEAVLSDKGVRQDGPPLLALLTHGEIAKKDQEKIKKLGIQVFQKPKRGKEQDFIQSFAIWISNV